jgi:hypothetical protein
VGRQGQGRRDALALVPSNSPAAYPFHLRQGSRWLDRSLPASLRERDCPKEASHCAGTSSDRSIGSGTTTNSPRAMSWLAIAGASGIRVQNYRFVQESKSLFIADLPASMAL